MRTLPDKFKQRFSSRGHFTAFVLILVAATLLAGCVEAPVRSRAHAAAAQPLARLDLPENSTAGQVSAWLIAAEFALQRHDATTAAHAYAKAAQLSNDPKLARQALQFALVNHDESGASALLRRWQTLGAKPRELAGARARLALLRGDRATAEKQFNILLAPGDADDWKTFGSDLLAARDSALAGRVLEDLAKPERLPASESVWVALSQLGEHLGRHAFARKLADAAVQRFDGADSIRWAASLRLDAGDHAEALAMYARGVKAHPRNVELRLGYAALLGGEHRYVEALKVLSRGPQTSATWSARVAFAARAKNDAALRRIYAQLRQAPAAQRVGDAFLLGQLAELLQHDKQALHWYGDVDDNSPHTFEARTRSAVLQDKAGNFAEAHTQLRRLEQDYADDPDSLRTVYAIDAQLYARRGQHAKAIAAYARGLAVLPNDPTLVYGRGIEEATAGETDAALKDFRRVLKLKPGDVEAMNALGFTLADADRNLTEAAKLLKQALAAKPDEAAIMDSWGWLQYRLGHFDNAKDWLQRAWGKHNDPDVGVHLGEVLWKLGQHQHARKVFAKVRKLDPDNAALRRVERKLQP